MKAEKPAEGILKTTEFGTCKAYYVHCECGNSECAHHVWIEASDFDVTISFGLTLQSKWYSMSRWKQIWQILTKGYTDVESTLVLNEQSAMNYTETLKTAMKTVKQLRDEKNLAAERLEDY
jgi:hypothetical protein